MSDLDFARAVFRKSSRSEGGNGCVEVAVVDRHHVIRDSKNPDDGVLALGGAAWQTFICQIKRGGHDL